MFSVSVLAGLPFPSRQSFKVIMFIVNSLKILVPTCYSPTAKVHAY